MWNADPGQNSAIEASPCSAGPPAHASLSGTADHDRGGWCIALQKGLCITDCCGRNTGHCYKKRTKSVSGGIGISKQHDSFHIPTKNVPSGEMPTIVKRHSRATGRDAQIVRPSARCYHNWVMKLTNWKSAVWVIFLHAGRHTKPTHLARLCKLLTYLEAGKLLAAEEARPQMVSDRFALFEVVHSKIVGQAPLYLEFGVFEGRSMRWWSSKLSQPDAKLVGFDSFEGLPEDWRPEITAGHFRTSGPPQIDDSRVSFQVGWFKETLARFTVPDHDQLILNVDCDVYSSASTVLHWVEPYLRPGTLIYFDEFPDRDHEMRAFTELCARSSRRFKPVAIANCGTNWLFETS